MYALCQGYEKLMTQLQTMLLGSSVFIGRPFYYYIVSFSCLFFLLSLQFLCRWFLWDVSSDFHQIFSIDLLSSEVFTFSISSKSPPVRTYPPFCHLFSYFYIVFQAKNIVPETLSRKLSFIIEYVWFNDCFYKYISIYLCKFESFI